jgi:hypothetical protein
MKLGSIVRVKLYDGRIVEGEVKAIFDTTSGRKIRILCDQRLLTVKAEQVIGEVRE